MKKLISMVIPIYNEEQNLDELYKRIKEVMDKETKYNFEVIAVEHGSKDASFAKLLAFHKKDKRVKILQLSKNFGSADAGISAGLNFARGEAAVILMADLQEPPELISKFLRYWEKGYEIVYGIVKKRPGASYARRISSVLFYKILNIMTGNIFPENVSDFRLMDKKVYQIINQMEERNKFLRGLIAWSGFNQIGIPFERKERFAGKSKADFFAVLKVAANGIFSFSYLPLRLVTILGFLLSIISFLLVFYQIALFIIYGRGTPGISTIVILVSFLFSMLFLILGFMGEYISRIYDEVKRRPNFIVREKIGL
ncbi:glycosyl transferase [Candidatus Gottesmanbacteria bacterium RIFCSPHIGHO2_01_FULL_39_10]|uniref:Glycosyl transferase n=1 Tax=Candidatus Gottesmanbacteria bacterium RIFCSPHIGHO2_01_FULL_39_10 TaxID=1798375 RepID=A0A1F5ZNT9_9BACT|nr:MAG: glycosyl transferase [Candidatus Gottesmanbacteria bacterium RIFCSPHIGHO2_01_FULL_39_10]